jgi:hypothetical protein
MIHTNTQNVRMMSLLPLSDVSFERLLTILDPCKMGESPMAKNGAFSSPTVQQRNVSACIIIIVFQCGLV